MSSETKNDNNHHPTLPSSQTSPPPPPPFKKLKAATTEANSSSPYKAEPIKPEWLELPPELKEFYGDTNNNNKRSPAWDKYYPYTNSQHLPMVPPSENPPTFTNKESPALCFQIHGICGRARACTIHFPNHNGPPVPTPRFMPVGTKGTLKGVLPSEIQDCMDCPIILANTYHLAIQPGTELIDTIFGGLPKFMGSTISSSSSSPNSNNNDDTTTTTTTTKVDTTITTKRRFNLLTDSGGFQMVSLAALSQVTEEGVLFESPYTNNKQPMLLRPEDSIQCQIEIGADIIMQLDDVVSSVSTDEERFRIATFRTLRWYDRCVKAQQQHEQQQQQRQQNLFPILQGALDISSGGLRELCLAGFQYRDFNGNQKIPGFAIGGLAGGESKHDFWKVVNHACQHLPDDRPRYLMGVGYPLDLVVCTALGVDLYDCVYPTRTARFGVALVDSGLIKLKQHEFGYDSAVIQENCQCQACSRGISRKRLHGLLKSGRNSIGVQLVTLHNVTYMMGLVNRMRNAILNQTYPNFCQTFINQQFPNPKDVPIWVLDAFHAAGITILRSSSTAAAVRNKAQELRQNSCFDPTIRTDGLFNYLKQQWDNSFQGLITTEEGKTICNKWFERLFRQHNEQGRFYHTAVHLKEILEYWSLHLDQDESQRMNQWSRVITWATFFHDAVYNPQSSQNEKDSASLFEQFWKELTSSSSSFCREDPGTCTTTTTISSASADSKLVVILIHATEKHQILTDTTMTQGEIQLQKVFLDMDMAVLGKEREAYLAYAGLIRKEFHFVDRSVYCEKRAAILTGFLQNKERIFLSDFFHHSLEAHAQANLKAEIDLLQAGVIPGEE